MTTCTHRESGANPRPSVVRRSRIGTSMAMTPRSSMTDRPAREAGSGLVRQTVELLVCLSLCVIVVQDVLGRGLRGADRLDGPDAAGLASRAGLPQLPVSLRRRDRRGGAHRAGRSARIAARRTWIGVPAVECGGDRVLVQKFLYDFRTPKRWEVAVFHYPGDPSQAYVKRVVGLPGESIRIDRRRRLRRRPDRSASRWTTSGRCGSWCTTAGTSRTTPAGSRAGSSGRAGGIGRGPPAGRGPSGDSCTGPGRRAGPGDWVIYRHWDPTRGRYGPVRDFYAYNGGELPADNEVPDLGLEARMTVDRLGRGRSRRRCGRGPISSWSGSRSASGARSSWCTTASGCRSRTGSTRSTTEGRGRGR